MNWIALVLLPLSLTMSSAAPNIGSPHKADLTAIPPMELEGLELVWTTSIGSNRLAGGITSDSGRGAIYAIHPAYKNQDMRTCSEIDSRGGVRRTFKQRKANRLLRAAHLRDTEAMDLLLFSHWTRNLVAVDPGGSLLWVYDFNGINDVWARDLDGDGFDEVIVGYNGSTGLHVLDRDGKLRWKNQQEGNIWHVCAADLEGDGKLEVITTSSKGKIRVFKGDGTRLPDIGPPAGYYGDLVRPVKLSDSGRSEGILVTGSGRRVAALKSDGQLAWEVAVQTSLAGNVAECAPGRPWLALLSADQLVVLDTIRGSIIARGITPITGRGYANCHLCWLEVKAQSSPLLVISTPQSIEAYRVIQNTKPGKAERAGEKKPE